MPGPVASLSKICTWNDLMFAISARAKVLADFSMHDLRFLAGYNCETAYEAQQANKGKSRGELIDIILTEEFDPGPHHNPEFIEE